jgi:hypothetical protein
MITPLQYLDGSATEKERALFELDALRKAATAQSKVGRGRPFHEEVAILADKLEESLGAPVSVDTTLLLKANAKALRESLARFGLYQRG